MARTLVYQFPVTIPAGTPQAAPIVTPTTFEPNIVERIEWLFPAGCNGLVGIQIGARSVQVLPTSPGAFFTRSGDSSHLDVADVPETGDWSVIGYNTGANPHTVNVTFIVHRKEPALPPLPLFTDSELSFFPTYAGDFNG